jgi:choice-of-anchor B domain-containing protein
MRASTTASLLACTLASAAVLTALAHEDDGKVRDREPAVQAPAWREADGGLAGETFDAQGIVLKAWFPLASIDAGATSGNDCWGYVSPSGREYAIMCVSNGTAVYEVTNPAAPVKLGFIPGAQSLWRDAKVFGNRAYVVTEGGVGIQTINLSQVDSGVISLESTVTAGSGGLATHNVAINEQSGYLYRCGGGSSGLRFYNLNVTPGSPQYVGEWAAYYVHDAQIVSYTSGPYAGKEIAFCCAGLNGGNVETGLYVVDVTNKAAPVLLSRILYPNARYSHQGWLTEDRKYFLLGDELDEGASQPLTTTYVIDVQNLTSLVYKGQFGNSTPAITHNCYTHNGKMFQANYRSGMRVFDVSNAGTPSSVTEVAYFDTYPGSDSAQFNGLWSCFPYFPSGTIIGSDLERGMFVWRLGEDAVQLSFPDGAPTLVSPAGQAVTFDAVVQPGVTVTNKRFLYNTPAGTQGVSVTQLDADTYSATLPAVACGSAVGLAIEFTTATEVFRLPSTGFLPATAAFGVAAGFTDEMEINQGWTVGGAGDAATAGIWVRADPVGTAAQPEDDHTAAGVNCWITGNGAVGGGLGAADIDGGQTTLTSPVFDATVVDTPYISYWRWYSNNAGAAPNEDSMPVEISNNGGTSWVLLETVTQNAGAWVEKSFRIADVVPPTSTMRIRFRASDLLSGSVVEAGVDDVKLYGFDCTVARPADLNGDGAVDGADLGILLGNWGNPGAADLDGNGTVDGADLGALVADWG